MVNVNMRNRYQYIYAHNNLVQCLNILSSVINASENHNVPLGMVYKKFFDLRQMFLKRTDVDIFSLGNTYDSKSASKYCHKLIPKDKSFYSLHTDVYNLFKIQSKQSQCKAPCLWIINKHLVNAMSRTDILTVLDSANIQLESQLYNIDEALRSQKSVSA